MFFKILQMLIQHWVAIIVLGVVARLLRNKFHNGLNRYPGPFIAGFTNWWRFWDVYKSAAQLTHQRLHEEHGDFVRLGPNVLSVGHPQAIRDIYGLNKGYVKTDFYPIQQAISKGTRIATLFSTTDEQFHAQLKRVVSGAFAMSNLVSLEPLVDSTTRVFLAKTASEFCETGKSCDFSRWLQYYAFDVIGEMTWSKRLGFIERNEDVDGITASLAAFFRYSSFVGQQPWLDLIFDKNPLKLLLSRWGLINTSSPAAIFGLKQSEQRKEELEKIKAGQLDEEEEQRQDHAHAAPAPAPAVTATATAPSRRKGVDFLTRFTQAQREHPQFFNDFRKFTATMSLVNAGSDTTAISLSSVFYHLLRYPDVYKKLMHEIDAAPFDPSTGVFSWSVAQQLPYLDAVVQESFRMFPAAGLILERHVPAQGATICGERIPGGTIVGCNAWVLHRRKDIFGADAYTYRPERWIEAAQKAQADPADTTLKNMKATMFQFGSGPRTCIGRNISLLEMYKLVPSFLRRFTIEFVHPEKDWTLSNHWFIRQDDFLVRFKPREVGSGGGGHGSSKATKA